MAYHDLRSTAFLTFLRCTITFANSISCDYIDLSYAGHTVTTTNTTAAATRVDIYKDIRFAKPPVDELTFKYAQEPAKQAGIHNGTISHDSTCISSVPAYATYPPFNDTHFGSEDCLFLDVYVPRSVKPADTVPVLHWLCGSAHAFGGKDFFSNPMGLFGELLSHN